MNLCETSALIGKTPCNPRGIPKRYENGIPLGYTSWDVFIPLGMLHPKRYTLPKRYGHKIVTQELSNALEDVYPRGMHM